MQVVLRPFMKFLIAILPTIFMFYILIELFPYTGLGRIVALPTVLFINAAIVIAGIILIKNIFHAEHPELPLFIAAHSLGGVIALDYGLHHGEGVAGLIAIAPAISYEAKPSEKLLIALMGKLMPEYTIDKPSNLQQLTRDPDMLSRLQADTLRHNTVTPGLGRGLMRMVPRITKQANVMKLPLLLLYGLGDDITPPAKLRQFFDAVGSEDKLKLEYNEMRHRPFDEIGREHVFADILRWLDRQTGTL